MKYLLIILIHEIYSIHEQCLSFYYTISNNNFIKTHFRYCFIISIIILMYNIFYQFSKFQTITSYILHMYYSNIDQNIIFLISYNSYNFNNCCESKLCSLFNFSNEWFLYLTIFTEKLMFESIYQKVDIWIYLPKSWYLIYKQL